MANGDVRATVGAAAAEAGERVAEAGAASKGGAGKQHFKWGDTLRKLKAKMNKGTEQAVRGSEGEVGRGDFWLLPHKLRIRLNVMVMFTCGANATEMAVKTFCGRAIKAN